VVKGCLGGWEVHRGCAQWIKGQKTPGITKKVYFVCICVTFCRGLGTCFDYRKKSGDLNKKVKFLQVKVTHISGINIFKNK